ncbi:MAG: dipeptidase [Planctomycetota bacterium]
MQDVIDFLKNAADEHVERLQEWLRIPSVSTDSARDGDVRAAGEFVARELTECGFETKIWDTPGHPVVTANWLQAEGAPTVLIYGHYDVQPPEPLELWRHGPFEPTIEGRNLVARGATDDKGQAYALLRGITGYLKVRGSLPVNVKFLFEGEEEIGSPNLVPFIEEHEADLKADIAVVSDTSQFGPGMPAITVGLKGLCYLEVELTGASHDLHSGSFGGAVDNPANVLTEIIGKLRDADGRITIPGFYDNVRDLTDAERAEMKKLPFDEGEFQKELDAPALFGEKGYSTLERKWARPTLDVNGLLSGWTGPGAKTVLPCKAMAKFSMRLVADQNPDHIAEITAAHLQSLCPPSVRMTVTPQHGAEPVLVPSDSPFFHAANRALAAGFGAEPVAIREGGSIPVVSDFKKILGIDTILLGLGLPDDGAHSPNEKFNLDDFQRGIETAAHLVDEFSRI